MACEDHAGHGGLQAAGNSVLPWQSKQSGPELQACEPTTRLAPALPLQISTPLRRIRVLVVFLCFSKIILCLCGTVGPVARRISRGLAAEGVPHVYISSAACTVAKILHFPTFHPAHWHPVPATVPAVYISRIYISKQTYRNREPYLSLRPIFRRERKFSRHALCPFLSEQLGLGWVDSRKEETIHRSHDSNRSEKTPRP